MPGDLTKALSLLDALHAEDPTTVLIDGISTPYELHYAQKMTSYLHQRAPDPSDLLQLAIRAQHLCRFQVPRSSYPEGKPGYFAWRTYLKKRHGEMAAGVLRDSGYSEEEAMRVASLVRKENLKKDEETQEDVACLVFLDDQFEAFEKEHDEDKIIHILRKTWVKMSSEGQALALKMDLNPRASELVGKALAPDA